MEKKLYKLRDDKMVSGVCAGVAQYFKVDPTIVRLLWVIASVAYNGVGVILYIVLAIILPEANKTELEQDDVEILDQEGKKVSSHDPNKTKQLLGFGLVILGGIMLFERVFKWFDFNMIIAAGIVALGVYIVMKGSKKE